MHGNDIPQANSLDRVREVVQAVKRGAVALPAIERDTNLSARHAGYYTQAARVLGVLRHDRNEWTVSEAGLRLLATPTGSAAESMVLRQIIRDSAILHELTPDLLDEDKTPSLDELTVRIMKNSELALVTAQRRAQALLAWRERVFSPVQATLFDDGGPPSPRSEPPTARPTDGLRVSAIAIHNYGLIRELSVPLRPSTVIIGRNATGKSTFMDSLIFISDALNDGITEAVNRRSTRFEDLLWQRKGDRFQISLDFSLPEDARPSPDVTSAHYEIAVGVTPDGSIGNLGEQLVLLGEPGKRKGDAGKVIVSMSEKGVGWFGSERTKWKTIITLGPNRLALSEVRDDPGRSPAASRIRDVLRRRVQRLALNPRAMIEPCSPRSPSTFMPDGSNLPIVVRALSRRAPELHQEWIDHVREALPEVVAVNIGERADDRHLYLKLAYKGGLELPAWRLSEGTLRILALTLIPFAVDADGIFLIEEPENGIHPQAVEAVHQALANPVRIQIVVATHSPVFVGIVDPNDLLCFSIRNGSTAAIPGAEHPALRAWRRDIDLGTLFASQVLE